jgi:hypothetical protein
MKRTFLLMAVPALLVTLGFAQTPAAGPKADQTNIKGCLAGTDGNYTVAEDGTGHLFKITTSSVDLKAHLGHDVTLTGNKAGDASSAAGDSFAVTALSMISEHCTGAAAAVAPVGMATAPTTAATVPEATVSTPSETAATPAATVSAPAATVSTPPETTAAPAEATIAPAATVSTPSETVTTPPVATTPPTATLTMPTEPVAAPPSTAKTPVATVSTPAVAAASPARASERIAKQLSKPASAAAAASAANAENAKAANTPTSPDTTPAAATNTTAQPASTPDAPIATPTVPAKNGFPTWLGLSIVVVVLILGASIPLFSRWRKRKMLEQTQNLSFTHKTIPAGTIPPKDKSGPPATGKAA